MEGQTVPFPSVSRFNDEMSPERRSNDRTPHGRVVSSPTLPDWSLHLSTSGARPRLNPLDLAVARPSTPPPMSSKYLQPLLSPSLRSAQNSPRKDTFSNSMRVNSGSPNRITTLLTPPLTPSSSFNSASTVATESEFGGDADVVPSTPPDGGSPLTWGKLRLSQKRPSIVEVGVADDVPVALASTGDSVAELNARMRRMDLTPRFEKKFVFGNLGEQGIQMFAEGEKASEEEARASRFLLIHHVSPRTTESDIRNALSRLGVSKIKGVIRLQPQGTILIVFYDLRDAVRSAAALEGKTCNELNKNEVRLSSSLLPVADERKGDEMPLRVEYTDKATLQKVLQNRPPTIWVGTESTVLVEAFSTGQRVAVDEVRKILTSLGALADFKPASPGIIRTLRASNLCGPNSNLDSQLFVADYYDSENASTARQQLDNRTIFHMRFRIYWASDVEGVSEDEPEKEQVVQDQIPYPLLSYSSNGSIFNLSSPPQSSMPLPESPTPKRGGDAEFSVNARFINENENRSPAAQLRERGKCGLSTASPSHYDGLFFDSLDRAPPPSQNANGLPNINMGPEQRDLFSSNFHYTYNPFGSGAPPQPDVQPYQSSSDRYFAQPLIPQPTGPQFAAFAAYQPCESYSTSGNVGYSAVRDSAGWIYPSVHPVPEYSSSTGNSLAGGFGERGISSSRIDGKKHPRVHRGQASDHDDRTSLSTFGRSSSGSSFDSSFASSMSTEIGFGDGMAIDKAQVSEKNQLNIANIENGLDTRTTVMIKNIPNKMSDKDLMTFIDRVCPRRIDFLYLRMDFQNGCNVGYAFVNFITVQDLLLFTKTQLGIKWNMYSSEKVLQMSYANYQGKEALVEKFKNSCIMDEREAWRPKIFFSNGPSQGLPEPFPPPTHLRRKERSASNRGALFVPAAHHYNGHGHGHGHHRQQHSQFQGQFREQGYAMKF